MGDHPFLWLVIDNTSSADISTRSAAMSAKRRTAQRPGKPRSRHLREVSRRTPRPSAQSATKDHLSSEITASMPNNMDKMSTARKHKMSSRCCPAKNRRKSAHNERMPTKTDFRDAFCARVRAAREASGYTQKEMARLLGVSADNYVKYESRSHLPHHLIERFCLITKTDMRTLLAEPELLGRKSAV